MDHSKMSDRELDLQIATLMGWQFIPSLWPDVDVFCGAGGYYISPSSHLNSAAEVESEIARRGLTADYIKTLISEGGEVIQMRDGELFVALDTVAAMVTAPPRLRMEAAARVLETVSISETTDRLTDPGDDNRQDFAGKEG